MNLYQIPVPAYKKCPKWNIEQKMVIIKHGLRYQRGKFLVRKVSLLLTIEEDDLWKRKALKKLPFNDNDKGTPTSTEDLERTVEQYIRSTIFSREIETDEAVGNEGSILNAGQAVSASMSGLQSVRMMTSK